MLLMKVAYIALVILAVVTEHFVFSRIWKAYELARWVMGVATVMILLLTDHRQQVQGSSL